MTASEITQYLQIIQSISFIIGMLFAIYGLDAWRREHIGKRKIELAEETLSLFYQARDAIEDMRNPVGFQGEGKTRIPVEGETPEHKEDLDQAYVLIERYNRYSELFGKIYAIRYRFMAQVGVTESKPFDDLIGVVNRLLVSARQMARLSTMSTSGIRTNEHQDKFNQKFIEVHNIYYAGGGSDDPIEPTVNLIIENIETTCRSIIDSKSTLYSLINARLPFLLR